MLSDDVRKRNEDALRRVLRHIYAADLQVACPVCGAAPGERCTGKGLDPDETHASRMVARFAAEREKEAQQ